MKAAQEKLVSASHKLAEVMYQAAAQQAGQQAPGAQPGGASGDGSGKAKTDNVVDAEFVDVDENSKK
jgi:molecular chaperone DnaK